MNYGFRIDRNSGLLKKMGLTKLGELLENP